MSSTQSSAAISALAAYNPGGATAAQRLALPGHALDLPIHGDGSLLVTDPRIQAAIQRRLPLTQRLLGINPADVFKSVAVAGPAAIAMPAELALPLERVRLCYSSCWMTKLLSWRNPEQPASTLKSLLFAGKAITTELALPVLTVSALVETAAYAALYSVSSLCLLAFPKADRIREFSIKTKELLNSSSTTIYWGIKNFAYSNLFKRQVGTAEIPIRHELIGYFNKALTATGLKK